jgi:hypothetical protein
LSSVVRLLCLACANMSKNALRQCIIHNA